LEGRLRHIEEKKIDSKEMMGFYMIDDACCDVMSDQFNVYFLFIDIFIKALN